jgi:hypothetical protein
MAAMTKAVILTDQQGRVLAARLDGQAKDQRGADEPTADFAVLEGHRELTIELPTEVLDLPGPDLHHFFSQVKIRWPAEVQLPKVRIDRKHQKPRG